VPLKRWYFPTNLHSIAFRKNVIFCIKTVRITDMKFYGISTLSLLILFNYISSVSIFLWYSIHIIHNVENSRIVSINY
jgi:hypothetical protein